MSKFTFNFESVHSGIVLVVKWSKTLVEKYARNVPLWAWPKRSALTQKFSHGSETLFSHYIILKKFHSKKFKKN